MPGGAKQWGEQALPYANHPRENVSWYQAVAFCRWLRDKLGYKIDLPHEHEWEVAARYPDGRKYPWGNEFNATKANTSEGDSVGQTTTVGICPSGKNKALNLYDMSGNVWEWCRNKYEHPEVTAVDQSDALRIVRGGSWRPYLYNARAAYRNGNRPSVRNGSGGFRVVYRSLNTDLEGER